MDSCTTESWKHSLLYLTFVVAILHLMQSQFSRKLFLGNETVRIKKFPDLPLRFRSDGTFKILQVADMHYGSGTITRCRDVLASEFEFCSDLNTTRFLKRIIHAENPDFIAFTGDNIFGSSTPDAAESLFKAFGPAMESGLPWAAVLGNHDQESTMNREELMSFISLMDYSVSQINPSADGLTNPTKVGTGLFIREFELMDGSRTLNFVGFVMFLKNSRSHTNRDKIRILFILLMLFPPLNRRHLHFSISQSPKFHSCFTKRL